MKKSELHNIIKEEIKNVLNEVAYRGLFSVEKGQGNSAKDWKDYIKNIPGVMKVSTYPSAYVNHVAVDVMVKDKATISKVIKAWRNYGINWPEAEDFEAHTVLNYMRGR